MRHFQLIHPRSEQLAKFRNANTFIIGILLTPVSVDRGSQKFAIVSPGTEARVLKSQEKPLPGALIRLHLQNILTVKQYLA